MPTIKKLEKKEKSTFHNETENRQLRMSVYNTTRWRKLRDAHLREQPCCERCWLEGKAYAGTPQDPIQVHHLFSPFKNGEIDWEKAYDPENLETICSYHHGLEHNHKPDPQKIIDDLEELLNGTDSTEGN